MKNIEATIRPAIEADSNLIFSMASTLAQSFDVAGHHHYSDFVRILNDPNYVLLVIRVDERIVGYIFGNIHYAFYAAGNIAWIEELYIDDSFRGQSLGTKLINRFESIVIDKSVRLISVATRRASSFYLKNGYIPSAEYYRKVFH